MESISTQKESMQSILASILERPLNRIRRLSAVTERHRRQEPVFRDLMLEWDEAGVAGQDMLLEMVHSSTNRLLNRYAEQGAEQGHEGYGHEDHETIGRQVMAALLAASRRSPMALMLWACDCDHKQLQERIRSAQQVEREYQRGERALLSMGA